MPPKSNSKKSKKSNKKIFDTKPAVPTALPKKGGLEHTGSVMHNRADELRTRLGKFDAEAREFMNELGAKLEKQEIEQTALLRKECAAGTEDALAAVQKNFRMIIENAQREMRQQQEQELERVKKEDEGNADACVQQKKKEMDAAIETKERENRQDVDKFIDMREIELAEQINRIMKACDQEVAEYAKKREQGLKDYIEQIRQKTKLELANSEQRRRLDVTVKTEEIIKKFQNLQYEQISRLNQQLTDEMTKTKQKLDEQFTEKIREMKAQNKEKLETARKQFDEKSRNEREEIEKELTVVDKNIKNFMKVEQRDMERRIKMKKELLSMMEMSDLIKITEEEFIESKYGFKINRNQMISQNQRSSFYSAKWRGPNATQLSGVCKVTMKNNWSGRHQNDFNKNTTKILRYLAVQMNNREKMIKNRKGKPDLSLPFARVSEIFMSESKYYIFMDQLEPNKTLDQYLGKNATAKRNAAALTMFGPTTMGKEEFTNVLYQLANGIHFLNRMFIAHANLTLENITITTDSSLTTARVILTGLTRPVVFYNVESDALIQVKGIDHSSDNQLMEYYPAEGFSPQFTPSCLDVYSFGVIAAALVKSKSPFTKAQLDSTKKLIQLKSEESIQIEITEFAGGKDLAELIAQVTHPNMKERLVTDDLITHKFFQ